MAKLLTAVAARVGMKQARTGEFDELQRDVQPEQVLDTLQRKSASTAPLPTETLAATPLFEPQVVRSVIFAGTGVAPPIYLRAR